MKKRLIGLFLGFLCLSIAGIAQEKDQIREKIEARKIAFITDKLQLTPTEAQQFWPLYNEYQSKRKTITKNHKRKGDFQLMTDGEVEAYLEQQLVQEEKLLNLKKEYLYKMKNAIPVRKVARLQRVENRFKQWMLEQIKKRRGRNK